MRHNRFTGAVAAAALTAGSMLAVGSGAAAAPTTAPQAEAASTEAPTTVVLPTGDRVTLLPNGSAGIAPALGREDASFITPPSPSGDVIVVPTDKVAAVLSGEEDPRRYNVSELLRGGHTDATDVSASELDDREYAGLIPDTSPQTASEDEETVKLRVDLRMRDGGVPEGSWVLWSDRDGEDFDFVEIDESGGGSVAVPEGDYVIVGGFWNAPTDTERGETIMGMVPVTVEGDLTHLVMDGSTSSPVSVEVEQPDAEFLNATMMLSARAGDNNLGFGTFLDPLDDAFLLPEPDLEEFELDFIYQPVLADPEGEYVYNLAFAHTGGFPSDAAYSVTDAELAVVAAEYRDLGVPNDGYTCDYGDTAAQIGMGFCRMVETPVPAQRTMYYTPGPQIEWGHLLVSGVLDEDLFISDGFTASRDAVYGAGPAALAIPNGGLSSPTADAYRSTFEGTEYFEAYLSIGGGNGETVRLVGGSADFELSRDGEVLASAEGFDPYMEYVIAELPEGDSGRYTLAFDYTASAATTVFGTAGSNTWEFDSTSVAEGEWTPIAFPTVALEADDIAGGYAPRRGCQEITLEMRNYEWGPVTHAVDMAFEVSYDDGATWKSVDIDRDGDTATAELRHPRGAEFVSIRTTVVDDAGTENTNTVIRAYGLR
ncbi:hypothetical protein AB0B28_03410 [Glycomyces sp. NPDC046736]|uniref:hypothetical protein n=1 Tax=Glycomyces sp. NPDC046736 TaxID=3155615 RepID=UPI0033E35732